MTPASYPTTLSLPSSALPGDNGAHLGRVSVERETRAYFSEAETLLTEPASPWMTQTKDRTKTMADQHPNNPLHGKTLEHIVVSLVDHYGWQELGWRIKIGCFNSDPSIKSSLKFLRRTPWARKQVEDLYIASGLD